MCTGLFDKHDQDLNYYKELFQKNLEKMICTNPDLIVDRGSKRELCAGSVAMVYEKWVRCCLFWKNLIQKFIINQSIIKIKILSIGDNLNTDIKGANLLNFDSLLISSGIHKDEIKEKGIEKNFKIL